MATHRDILKHQRIYQLPSTDGSIVAGEWENSLQHFQGYQAMEANSKGVVAFTISFREILPSPSWSKILKA